MSEVLITGATGTVGWPIARDLAARGDSVRALVRDVDRARALLPDGVEPVRGDVADRESVRSAVAGAELVFHAAGLPEQWRRDPGDFTRVNVEGTRNVAEEALAAGVRRFAYTSTIDVFRWTPGRPFDERVIDPDPAADRLRALEAGGGPPRGRRLPRVGSTRSSFTPPRSTGRFPPWRSVSTT